MCINFDTLRHVMPPPCHPQAGWQPINPGADGPTRSQIVAACTACHAEWSLRLNAEKITAPRRDALAKIAPTEKRVRRSREDVIVAVAHARRLVESGTPLIRACAEAGVDRKTYQARAGQAPA
jgi:hypothetical protein